MTMMKGLQLTLLIQQYFLERCKSLRVHCALQCKRGFRGCSASVAAASSSALPPGALQEPARTPRSAVQEKV